MSTQFTYSQINNDINQNDRDTSAEQVDSGRDSTTIVNNSIFDIFYGKPGKAAFYGLVIPGGGQIYNKKWWKLPFVYAVEGGTIYWIIASTRNYKELQTAYLNNLDPLNNLIPVGDVTDVNILLTNRNRWRKQKEYSWIFFLGGHLITIFESFIDRHLMEFDVSDDLTFEPIPSVIGSYPGVTYTIGLNKKKDIVYKDLLGE
ncbi:MAG: hypothetical protein ACJATI_001640 [Halioglobus sp.]|jgi:hypothetical protein